MRALMLALVVIGAGACGSSGSPNGNWGALDERVGADLHAASARAALGTRDVAVETVAVVGSTTLQSLAAQVVEATALLKYDASLSERVVRPYEDGNAADVQDFLARGLMTRSQIGWSKSSGYSTTAPTSGSWRR